MCIYQWCVILVVTAVLETSTAAETPATSVSSRTSEETSEQPQTDPNAISGRNALAQPSAEKPTRSMHGTATVKTNAYNNLILEMIDTMPIGGDYRASTDSIQKLEAAIKKEGNEITINSSSATPSFCSSATYLVFVSTLEKLNRQEEIQFNPGIPEKLLVTGQHDGVGVWGRWNANGPGTARLFGELGLGHNFTSIEEAQAGDFLKIFWTDQIGAKEIGHSVIYLGHRQNSEGIELVRYWSSNKKGTYAEGGYGKAEVPLSKIKQMLFSRLEDPNKINNIGDGLKRDEYLASMLINSSTPEEMKRMVGIRRSAGADAIPVSSVSKEKGANGIDLKVDREKQK
jgi:hypothetical protein